MDPKNFDFKNLKKEHLIALGCAAAAVIILIVFALTPGTPQNSSVSQDSAELSETVSPVSSTSSGAGVSIPEDMRVCATDNDCAAVNLTCDTCCKYQSVGKRFVPDLNGRKDMICRKYKNMVCECDDSDVKAVCVDKVCQIKGEAKMTKAPQEEMEPAAEEKEEPAKEETAAPEAAKETAKEEPKTEETETKKEEKSTNESSGTPAPRSESVEP
jgi:hypothetical protein